MSKKLIILLICTSILLGCIRSQSQTQCGKASWWKDIESNLVSHWDNSSKIYKDYLDIRTNEYDSNIAVLINQTHGLKNGFCKGYFTPGTDLSCCVSQNYTKLINSMIRLSIASAVPEQKGDLCRANQKKLEISLGNCTRSLKQAAIEKDKNETKKPNVTIASQKKPEENNQTITSQGPQKADPNSANPQKENSNRDSGFLDKNKQKNSLQTEKNKNSSSTSTSSSNSESANKLRDAAEQAGKASEAKSKKLMAQLAVGIARQLRGSLCAVCGDPDKASSLFDPTNQTWFVNQKAYENHTSLIAQIFKSTQESNGQCYEFLNYRYSQWQIVNKNSTCDAASSTLIQSQVELFPCQNQTECLTKAQQCASPLSSNCLDQVTSEEPEDEDIDDEQNIDDNYTQDLANNSTESKGNSNSTLRALQQQTTSGNLQFQISENGGAIIIEDSDDTSIQVGGVSVQAIQQLSQQTISQYQNSDLKANFTAALEQEKNNNQDLQSENANSSSVLTFGLLIMLIALHI